MKNSIIWLNFYKKNLFSDVTQVETFSTISYKCISYARELEAEKNMSRERDYKLGLRYILKEQAIKSIITMPDLVSTPYKGIALGVEKLGVKFQKPAEVVALHRKNAIHLDDLRAVRRPIDRPELRPRGIHRCFPQYAVTFENNFHTMSGTINDEVVEIDRVRGFLYIETAFYKVVLFIASINAVIRRPFFWPLYED